MKPIVRVTAAFLALGLAVGGAHLIRSSGHRAPDYPAATITSTSKEVDISIQEGATGSDIATLLARSDVVKSQEALFRVFVGDERSQRIAPGLHRLSLRISARQALEQLLDPARMPDAITIIEGAWNSEIIHTLRTKGYGRDEINRAFAALTLPKGFTSSEGLLFPSRYSFVHGTPLAKMVQAMVDNGVHYATQAGIFSSRDSFKPAQLLTIASIIQQEGDTQDFGKISRVIRNRLTQGMPLQLDSTVHYIKKTRGSVFLSTESTFVRSPYNTYRRYGLPPTPIGNPGMAAMKAALAPVEGSWLYFITVKPGDTRFTDSLDQFNLWKAEYKKNLAAGAFS